MKELPPIPGQSIQSIWLLNFTGSNFCELVFDRENFDLVKFSTHVDC